MSIWGDVAGTFYRGGRGEARAMKNDPWDSEVEGKLGRPFLAWAHEQEIPRAKFKW